MFRRCMWGDTCMKYDCLIIDDEEVLAKNTCEYFNMFDVKTFVTFSVAGAETFFKENDASLLLLDINLGDGSGFEFCKKIRESKNIPILFISIIPYSYFFASLFSTKSIFIQ